MVSGFTGYFGQVHQFIPEKSNGIFKTMFQLELHQGRIHTNIVKAYVGVSAIFISSGKTY